jgi:putative ABC transport system permease protein
MLFLIAALAMGIFNANAARSVNSNLRDQIAYRTGADITIQYEKPVYSKLIIPMKEEDIIRAENMEMEKNRNLALERDYVPYKLYTEFPGAESTTKVLRQSEVQMTLDSGSSVSSVKTEIMGIYPNEFGRTAQLRTGLLPYHWYEYLNLIVGSPTAVLASTSFQSKYGAKIGDRIKISPKGANQDLECVIYAFIDYWPAFHPKASVNNGEQENLIVANLSYINEKLGFLPYEVWMKKKNGVSDSDFYKYLDEKLLPTKGISHENSTHGHQYLLVYKHHHHFTHRHAHSTENT